MLQRFKNLIIKWSLKELYEMYHSKKVYGSYKDLGVKEIVDFTDGEISIFLNHNKQQPLPKENRIEGKPIMKLVED